MKYKVGDLVDVKKTGFTEVWGTTHRIAKVSTDPDDADYPYLLEDKRGGYWSERYLSPHTSINLGI